MPASGHLETPQELVVIEDGLHAIDDMLRTFERWMIIAEALDVGRAVAMRVAGVDRPAGDAYQAVFGEWLQRWPKLELIKPVTRTWLSKCRDNLDAINQWRAQLGDEDRLRWNYPERVYQKWQESLRDPVLDPPPRKRGWRERERSYQVRIEDLTNELTGVYTGNEAPLPLDEDPEEIAAALLFRLRSLNIRAQREILQAMLRQLDELEALEAEEGLEVLTGLPPAPEPHIETEPEPPPPPPRAPLTRRAPTPPAAVLRSAPTKSGMTRREPPTPPDGETLH
jgi:hypothetical protein